MTNFPPSALESAFNFRDPTFYSYINVIKTGTYDAPPMRLIEMASDMSGHHHPLVRLAAGSAATEAGTVSYWSGIRNDWTLKNREEAIRIGNLIWYGIEDKELEQCAPTNDPDLEAELWALNLRRKMAIAYLPALQLAARARADKPITAQDAYGRFARVKQILLPTVGTLLEDPDDTSARSAAMRGLASEIATACLLQPEFLEPAPPTAYALPPEYIVTPASLRDDHHGYSAYRCDLNTYSVTEKGKRTSVQVGTPGQGPHHSFAVTRADLGGRLEPKQRFLRRIYQHEAGHTGDRAYLAEASETLRAGLKLYKQQHPKQSQYQHATIEDMA